MSSNIFSIEIFIDRIRLLEGEKCLFPSTVLKLLDYEPAIISTVDNDVQLKLRDYLDLIEKTNQTSKPTQLNELKDLDGNYVVRKGKSILFQANTLTLISEFNSLPLYILICDDYYYPNHLIGIVTIKLSETVISLARKISKTNHTVSEDMMGKFPIVNLIGDAVGFITMKLRLIYIGANLAPHLQEEQHIEVRIKSRVKDPVDRAIECGDPISEEAGPPEKVLVRNIGCQVNKHKSIRIQVPIESGNVENTLAKVGLTIDPNDPLLTDHPPMIYNSYYGNGEDTDSEPEGIPIKPIENPLSKAVKSLTKTPENVSILNELLAELKSWKSQNDLNGNPEEEKPARKPIGKAGGKFLPEKSQSIKRSKSVESATAEKSGSAEGRKDFLARLSKPKIRLNSPVGIVPKAKGWLRTEPEYCGPIRSQLEYKLTKTQSKRIELTNQKLFQKILQQKSINPSMKPIIYSSDFSSGIEPPIYRNKRNPLVPPLFGTGTSVSAPSFGTGSIDSQSPPPPRHKPINNRPPLSPGKEALQSQYPNRNNNNNSNYFNSKSISYDTNETINEADQYLNLNPVQSNRSPHMTRRSNHATQQPPIADSQSDSETPSTDGNAWRSVDNKDNEYSDGFNQSFSMENDDGKNQSRRYSMASQISQTSEWRTDYSVDSSNNHHNNHGNESNNSSPDFAGRKPHSKLQMRPKRTSVSSSNMNGGRFLDGNGSSSFRTFESGRPSFNESLEVSNMDADADADRIGYGDDDNIRLSIDQMDDNNNSMLRPNSVGADVTSFTKVTKYERSLNPGPMNSNYMGTHLVTSTVGSLRTEDSQTLTSEAYY